MSGAGVKPVFYASLLKITTWKTLTSHLKSLSKQQTPNKTKKETQPKLTPSPLPSCRTSSFTPNLHHRLTDCRSRTILRKKEFLLCPLHPPLGCAVLCLPKPPPHHTPEQNDFKEEEFTEAWKQTGVAMSHNPKVCFS